MQHSGVVPPTPVAAAPAATEGEGTAARGRGGARGMDGTARSRSIDSAASSVVEGDDDAVDTAASAAVVLQRQPSDSDGGGTSAAAAQLLMSPVRGGAPSRLAVGPMRSTPGRVPRSVMKAPQPVAGGVAGIDTGPFAALIREYYDALAGAFVAD